MQEMEVQAVDLGAELREAVELGLEPAPVVALVPVGGEGADLGDRRAL
jgi:hypothetical protein